MAVAKINRIVINPVVDATKTLTHVVGVAHGVIVTRIVDSANNVFGKRWAINGLLPGIELPGEPGYRRRIIELDGEPIVFGIREQDDDDEGELVDDYFEFVINGFGASAIPSVFEEDVNPPVYPVYYYISTGSTEELPVPNQSTYTWEDTLTYANKQEYAVEAISKIWRPKKHKLLVEAAGYTDINPDIPKHAGYWLKAADKALQIDFQDATVDPIRVAAEAIAVSQVANSENTINEFVVDLNKIIVAGTHPNGPTAPTLWAESDRHANATRLRLSESHDVPNRIIESDYNPIDKGWISENQPGIVTLDNEMATNTDTVTASVVDYDDITDATTTWQWEKLTQGQTEFTNISGATSAIYTVSGILATDRIRAKAMYTDGYGPGQIAYSAVVNKPGAITFDTRLVHLGDTVTATLTDPDGLATGQTTAWQWQLYRTSGGVPNWADLFNTNNPAYTIGAALIVGDVIRAVATYTDHFGAGQIAYSEDLATHQS